MREYLDIHHTLAPSYRVNKESTDETVQVQDHDESSNRRNSNPCDSNRSCSANSNVSGGRSLLSADSRTPRTSRVSSGIFNSRHKASPTIKNPPQLSEF